MITAACDVINETTPLQDAAEDVVTQSEQFLQLIHDKNNERKAVSLSSLNLNPRLSQILFSVNHHLNNQKA